MLPFFRHRPPLRPALCALAACLLSSTVACERPSTEHPTAPAKTASAPAAPPASVVPPDEYGTLPAEQREKPPAPGPTAPWSFPTAAASRLDNGLELRVVQRRSLPLVHAELVLRSGTATDGALPGLAVIAGELLKVGGSNGHPSQDVLNRLESLGSSLDVTTTRDSTILSLAVTSDRLHDALAILSEVLLKPDFQVGEFNKLKQRETDRVSRLAKSDAEWAANMVLYRELYRLPKGSHPYSHADAQPSEVAKVGLWHVKEWYRQHVTPNNALLVLAGDVDAPTAESAAKELLGGWKGTSVQPPTFSAPIAIEGLKIFLVDRPESPQAEVLLAQMGPPMKSDHWAALKVANQVLGGGVSGRLFLDVREQQSLAYSTYSYVGEVAHGAGPIVLKAGTQTAKAGLTLKALLSHAKALAGAPPTDAENQVATQYLADAFLLRLETLDALASLTTKRDVMGLPANYYDTYRSALREVTPSAAQAAFAAYVTPDAGLAVIAGDAARLAAPLSHFGDVVVIDPMKGFSEVRVVKQDPAAAIELPRLDGT